MKALLRRLYLQEILAPFALALAALAARHAGASMTVGYTTQGILRAFWQGVVVLWWTAPALLVALHRWGRLADPATDPTRARITVPLVRLFVGFGLIALAYSELKAFLPRVNGMLADEELLAADRILGFGRSYNERLGSVSNPWFVSVMVKSYLSFFFYFPLAMGIAFFRADREMLEEVIQGFALVFCLGLVGYYALPSLGSIYTHPEWHAPAHDTIMWQVRNGLLRQQVAIVQHQPTRIHAFFGIGAFPSLHVAHAIVALNIVGRRMPWVLWLAVPAFALMLLSTLFFGWHYLVDHAGALVVAYGALRLVRWDARRRAGVTGTVAATEPAA